MKYNALFPGRQSCSNGPLLTVVVRRELLKWHRGSFLATFRKCFTEELISTVDKAVHDIGLLDLDSLLREVKAVAVLPVAVRILRAMAHSAKQAYGERFQAFAAKVRGLTTDCNYVLPCPQAVAAAQVCTAVPDCRGVDYTSEVIKDILLSGIYDLDVRRKVLGTAGIEDKTVNDLVRIVEAKEVARDAAGGNRPAATAEWQNGQMARDPRKQDADAETNSPTSRQGQTAHSTSPRTSHAEIASSATKEQAGRTKADAQASQWRLREGQSSNPLPPAAHHLEKQGSPPQQWPTPTHGYVGRPQATPTTLA